MATRAIYPVRVEAELDPHLSRWLWLVKWLLAIPHYIVLAFLWVAFAVLSVVAFFAILFTGRYPRSIFEFNVGVLRWSWRVAYYSYGALGTDKYPPFTLKEVPDYATHLEIEYPGSLSRGLVLVKWWLLAIPHYLIVGVLMGGAVAAYRSDDMSFGGPGLIGLLVFIAGVALAVTAKYPGNLFDLILGLNRWVLRVAAYAGLMTDEYPPFRLDMGGSEATTGTLTVPPAAGAPAEATGERRGWTAGPIVAAIAGGIITLVGLGLFAGGGVLLWADQTQRDDAGFLTTGDREFSAGGYAIISENIALEGDGPDWAYPSSIIDEARVRATAIDDSEIFVGIAPTADARAYLDGVSYASADDFDNSPLDEHAGGAPAGAPTDQDFWAASSAGSGRQSVVWSADEGNWTIVVMNADGSEGVNFLADAGGKLPSLPWLAGGLLIAGGLGLLIGAALVFGAVIRTNRRDPISSADSG